MGFYDKMIKQLFEKCPRLVIRIINAMFGTNYPDDAEIIFLNREQSEEHETFMDMIIMIQGKKYHIEFQMLEDEMALRMFEYGMRDALREMKQIGQKDKYRLMVTMPEQAVIYLSGENEKDRITICVRFPDKTEVSYEVPCVSASITPKELSEKGMYILLPFQQVQLNDAMNNAKNRTERTKKELADKMYKLHENVRNWLNNLKDENIISVDEYEELLITFSNIEQYLLEKDATVKREVESMGDKDYIPYSERIKAEGVEQGIEQHLVDQIGKKMKKEKTVVEIAEELEENVDRVQKIVEIANKFAPEYEVEKILQCLKEQSKS